MRRVGEFDADDAGAALVLSLIVSFAMPLAVPLVVCRAHGRRAPAALFGPVADLVVVGRDLCLSHDSLLLYLSQRFNGAPARRVQPRRVRAGGQSFAGVAG